MDLALSDYRGALEYLFARTTGAFKFGLERTRALLAEMRDPHLEIPTLHIAGTNGKGSCVATADPGDAMATDSVDEGRRR